ncbi:MAG: RimK family alpha-L-glutamate ligase [Gammaproteobacteria bacterium]
MSHTAISCALLSTDNINLANCDDDLAYPMLAELGVNAKRVSWRATDEDWAKYDLVVVRTTWDYQDNTERFLTTLREIEAAGPLLANPLPVLRWNARKTYLADLQSKGIAIVPTHFGEALTPASLDALVAQFAGVEWVLKPDVGANSGGVFRLNGAPDVATRNALLERFKDCGYLAQKFVAAVTRIGEYSVFFFAGEYSHSILKTPKDGDFRVQEDYGANIRAVTPPTGLCETAGEVLAALPPDCLHVRVDLIADASGQFCLMEVELIEPSLYLRTTSDAPPNFARGLRRWYDHMK